MFGFARLARRFVTWGPEFRTYLHLASWHYEQRAKGECPCCGYAGPFKPEPHMLMVEGCPRCHALERQRLFALAVARDFVSFAKADVLHFAPDPIIAEIVTRAGANTQVTADLEPGRADRVLNIEALDLPDACFDRIICSHVLEHVNDARALAEMHRVLRPGGEAVLMVPIAEGWSETYENPAVTTEVERIAHFGQWDHVRYYGADLRERIRAQGFALREFTGSGADAARYRLARGERVFLAVKA